MGRNSRCLKAICAMPSSMQTPENGLIEGLTYELSKASIRVLALSRISA